jgi:hypothetical protein
MILSLVSHELSPRGGRQTLSLLPVTGGHELYQIRELPTRFIISELIVAPYTGKVEATHRVVLGAPMVGIRNHS